jgi:3-hydroxyanthranilate 3,4-dioxygenase
MLPINLQQWLEEHRHVLKPPVGNKVIWQDQDFICMLVGGPNARDDFHVEAGPEFFYQLEGEMVLRLMQDGRPHDVQIKAGQIYLLAPHIPHSPQRSAGGVGLVIERKRLPHEQDSLQWYCQACHHLIYQERFHLVNIETQFAAVFARFYGSVVHRSCTACGALHPERH